MRSVTLLKRKTQPAAARMVGALLTLAIGCNAPNAMPESFTHEIESLAATLQPDGEFSFTDIRTTDWSAVYIFPPYTPDTAIQSTVALTSAAHVDTHRLYEREDINLLVFVSGERVSMVVALPRRLMDFDARTVLRRVLRPAARFRRLAGSPVVVTRADE